MSKIDKQFSGPIPITEKDGKAPLDIEAYIKETREYAQTVRNFYWGFINE
jgi:hypothetical protein